MIIIKLKSIVENLRAKFRNLRNQLPLTSAPHYIVSVARDGDLLHVVASKVSKGIGLEILDCVTLEGSENIAQRWSEYVKSFEARFKFGSGCLVVAFPSAKIWQFDLALQDDWGRVEVESFVQYKLQQICQVNIREIFFDYQICESDDGARKLKIMASLRRDIDSYLGFFQSCSFYFPVLELDKSAFDYTAYWHRTYVYGKEQGLMVYIHITEKLFVLQVLDFATKVLDRYKELDLKNYSRQELLAIINDCLQNISMELNNAKLNKIVVSGAMVDADLVTMLEQCSQVPTVLYADFPQIKFTSDSCRENFLQLSKGSLLNFGLLLRGLDARV